MEPLDNVKTFRKATRIDRFVQADGPQLVPPLVLTNPPSK